MPLSAVAVIGSRIPRSHILHVEFNRNGLSFAWVEYIALCKADEHYRRFFKSAVRIGSRNVYLNGLFTRNGAPYF